MGEGKGPRSLKYPMPPLKRTAQFFFLLLIITLLDFLYLGRPSIGMDDANIFMNYAQHLSRGEGFVFHSGGERVEGFTSMLWVLICSIFYTLTSHPEWLMLFFLLVLTTISCSLVYEELKKDVAVLDDNFCRRYFFPAYVFFIICIGPYYATWSVLSLMENGLWNFLFLLIIIQILRVFRQQSVS